MTTLLCVRHGETDANLAGRWQGHDDQPLNATGRDQARRAVAALAGLGIDAIVASDLVRARDTALPLADALGLPVEERPEIREVDVGSWAGKNRDQVTALDPEGATRHADGGTGWTDGETYDELAVRVEAAIAAVVRDYPPDATIALFTHGGVIRAIAANAVGLSARGARLCLGTPVHLGLTTVRTRRGRWRLESYNVPLVEPQAQAAPPDDRRDRDDAAPDMETN
jgi:broad specificity phosphatase PhoE